MADFVGALDQGTTSTRFMIFDRQGREVAKHQLEHTQRYPQPGWVEHDPAEIWERTQTTIDSAMTGARLAASDLAAIGIANQRETTIVWNKRTGLPYYNAIVWQDTRTDQDVTALHHDGRARVVHRKTGLPVATYFSATKLRWILDNVPDVRTDAQRGDALFGTVDSWLVWNLTGGTGGGRHLTDVTNASRTMLMDLETLQWDDELLDIFSVPRAMLPEIRASSDPATYGSTRSPATVRGVPIGAALGDQQAATVGQVCFSAGEAKNTYGTGNFLLLNTGPTIVRSGHGLLTTVCHQFGGEPAMFALEGSIAVTGSAVQWLRDRLGIITSAADVEPLAARVPDTAGVYFVPAFSGLFAPHWRADARGAIVGLTHAHTSAHIARATLEAICYQTRDVVVAMQHDCGNDLEILRVDGGVTANSLCMQLQADILGVPVSRPVVAETTALGAAYAAGYAVGFWTSKDEMRTNWAESRQWKPEWSADRRAVGQQGWRKAIQRTLDWVETP
jgi:glycerol kinase